MNHSRRSRRAARTTAALLVLPLAGAALTGCQRGGSQANARPVTVPVSSPATAGPGVDAASQAPPTSSSSPAPSTRPGSSPATGAAASALAVATKQAGAAAAEVGSDLTAATSSPEGDPTR